MMYYIPPRKKLENSLREFSSTRRDQFDHSGEKFKEDRATKISHEIFVALGLIEEVNKDESVY